VEIDVKTGKSRTILGDCDYHAVKCVNEHGPSVAIQTTQGIEIWSQGKGVVLIDGTSGDWDAKFSQDGAELLLLPALIGGPDRPDHTRYFRRCSNRLKVVNVKNGKVIREIPMGVAEWR
jgi:hypothetical protein